MRIHAIIRTKAKKESIHEKDGVFAIAVKAAPREGKANQAILRALSRHFGVPAKRIRIILGKSSKRKIIEIP